MNWRQLQVKLCILPLPSQEELLELFYEFPCILKLLINQQVIRICTVHGNVKISRKSWKPGDLLDSCLYEARKWDKDVSCKDRKPEDIREEDLRELVRWAWKQNQDFKRAQQKEEVWQPKTRIPKDRTR